MIVAEREDGPGSRDDQLLDILPGIVFLLHFNSFVYRMANLSSFPRFETGIETLDHGSSADTSTVILEPENYFKFD